MELKLLIVFLNFAVCSSFLQAQEKIDLKIPAFPATAIIGSPGLEITPIGSYTELVTALTTEISPNAAALPLNLAVEFLPFYFTSRRGRIEDLDKANLFRDLRISVATTSIESELLESNFTRMGLGLRTYLIPGEIERNVLKDIITTITFIPRLKNLINRIERENRYLESYLKERDSQFNDIEKKKIKITIGDLGLADHEKVLSRLNILYDEAIAMVESPEKNSVYKIENRYGFILELGGALALDFPTGDLGYSQVNRWAAWLSPHILFKDSDAQFGGLLRLSNYSFDPLIIQQDFTYFDSGININYPFGEKINFIVEGVYRMGIGKVKTVESLDGSESISLNFSAESKLDFTIGYKFSDKVLGQISVDQFFGDWTNGVKDPTQLLLGLAFALTGEGKIPD